MEKPKRADKQADIKEASTPENKEPCPYCGKLMQRIHPFFRQAVGPGCPECSQKNAIEYAKAKWGM